MLLFEINQPFALISLYSNNNSDVVQPNQHQLRDSEYLCNDALTTIYDPIVLVAVRFVTKRFGETDDG